MSDLLLPGVAATRVETGRLTQSVLHPEGVDPAGPGEAVGFVHGNVSSALFWQQALLDVTAIGRHRALAVDLRGYGDTDPLGIDATRGVRDWSDDVAALITALGLDRVHLVGWSMGAGVVLQYLLDAPDRVASVALVAPMSPYGFGGTAGPTGRGSTRTGSVQGRARPTPPSSPPWRPATTRRAIRRAPGRSCGPSTSRRAPCHWSGTSRTSSWPRCSAPAPAPTTTPGSRSSRGRGP